MKAFKLFAFFLFVFSVNEFAQTPKVVEADLLSSFNRIGFWEAHQADSTYSFKGLDSLRIANDMFRSKLEAYLVKYPFTFNQKFSSIKHLLVRTSDDNMLKVYSWDDGTGGTMRFYKTVVQFKSKHKLVCKFLNNSSFINIYTVHSDKKTYYLLEEYGRAMSSYFGDGIRVWTIDNGNLNRKVKLFKTSSGIKNSINYSYWLSDKFSGDIHFDKKSNTLYIPLTTEKEKLTGKYITYKFTGQYFERIKIRSFLLSVK